MSFLWTCGSAAAADRRVGGDGRGCYQRAVTACV